MNTKVNRFISSEYTQVVSTCFYCCIDARIRVQQRIQERLIEMELSSPDYIAEHDSFESSTPMINLRNDVINIATQVLEQVRRYTHY
jgi:phage/plasmid-associated DNA primase